MYTFGILAIFFFILSGIIFGKNIKQNQFLVGVIVFVGTLIGSIIVNGVVGMKVPFTTVVLKEKPMYLQATKLETPDTTLKFKSYLQFVYEIKEDSIIKDNWVDVGYLHSLFFQRDQDRIKIHFLAEGDSVPYFKIMKKKRLVDNKWVTPFGIPRGGKRIFEVYIPNDSIHNILIYHLNEKYFKNEESEEVAKLD